MCIIHLDDAIAAILCQNAQHTPAYWCRRDRVMKPISVRGWLGDHDGQESGPRFNVSSELRVNEMTQQAEPRILGKKK